MPAFPFSQLPIRYVGIRWFALSVAVACAGPGLVFGGDRSAKLTVVSVAGAPVAGALVRVFPAADEIDLTVQPLAAATTDTHGNARVTWEEILPVRLLVSAAGFEAVPLPDTARHGRVVLAAGRDLAYEVRSDEPGRYRLSWDAGAGVRLAVTSDGRGRGILAGLPLRPTILSIAGRAAREKREAPAGVRTIVLDVRPAGAIAGRLLAPDGRPVVGGRVSLERQLTREASYTTKETVSSETGEFRLSVLAGGVYTLEFAAEGLIGDPVSVRLTQGQLVRLPPVRLRAGSSLMVRFANAVTGRPIVKPRLVVESNDPKGFSLRDLHRPIMSYVGDQHGLVRMDGLAPGPLSLALDSPPFARTRLPLVEIDGVPHQVDLGTIEVGEGASLEATVVDRTNVPVASIPAYLDRGPALSPLNPAETSTDGSGIARFGRLGRGRYRLRVGGDGRAGGRPTLREEWFSVDGDASVVNRRIVVGTATLDIIVVRETGPVAGRWVTLETDGYLVGPILDVPIRVEGSGESARLIGAPLRGSSAALTDASGRATISDVQPGSKRLVVELERGSWSSPLEPSLDNQTSSIVIPSGSAIVRVLDYAERSPVTGPRAIWTTAHGTMAVGFALESPVVVDGIPDGPGRLELTAAGYEGRSLDLADYREAPQEISLRKTGETSLDCRVVDEAGAPIAEAVIDLGRTYPPIVRKIALTDANGAARITGLEPGPMRLVVRRRGYASSVPTDLAVESGSNEVGVVTLSRGYRVNVITSGDDDESAAPVTLRLFDDKGVDLGQELDDESRLTFARGATVSIGPVRRGEYRLQLLGKASQADQQLTIVDADVSAEFK